MRIMCDYCAEFVRLLQKNAAREEIGLFDQARSLKPFADQIEVLCREQWDEIELAHRAIDAVWDDDDLRSPAAATTHAEAHPVTS
jgi:hypothetical protein